MLVIIAGNAVVAPLSAILVLVWVELSRTPWRDIGYVRPTSWSRTIAAGILFGIALKFLMKAVVMPLLGADPINQTYHYLVGNTAALPGMLFVMIVGAGFGEETVFRGFLFERLGRVFGHGTAARVLIVVVTSVFFGVVHHPDQGLPGVQQATIVGLVFGSFFAFRGKLFALMIAHAAFDLTALAIIYWDRELSVARLVFP